MPSSISTHELRGGGFVERRANRDGNGAAGGMGDFNGNEWLDNVDF